MRTISLLNSNGDELSLTSETLFLHDISNFGYERNDSYRIVGDGFVRSTKKIKQMSLSGTLAFAGESPYQQYYDFIKFCSYEPLTFVYTPEKKTFQRSCRLNKCEKSDLAKTGILDCKLEFITMTPWYQPVSIMVSEQMKMDGWTWDKNENNKTDSSKFQFTWPSEQVMTLNIDTDSNMDSPCKLMIKGPVTNPSWTVYTGGTQVSSGKVNVTVPENFYLVVDNTSIPYSIRMVTENGVIVEDEYQNSDFSTERFINFGMGNNVIVVTDDTGENVELRLECDIYYGAV